MGQQNGKARTVDECPTEPDTPTLVTPLQLTDSEQDQSVPVNAEVKSASGSVSTSPAPWKPGDPSPVVKHQNFFSGGEKNGTVSMGVAGETGDKEPGSSHGPSKVRRLFRRNSALKVFPDNLASEEGSTVTCSGETLATSGATASPSPTDSNKNHMFLFSGTLSPAAPTPDMTEAEEGFISMTQLYNAMNDGQVTPYICDPSFMLIIDTRMLEDYIQSHIVTAYHLSALHEPYAIEHPENFTMIILYDNKGLSHSLKDSVLSITLDELQSHGVEPFVLQGGFDAFFNNHPYLCTDRVPRTDRERQSLITPYPSIVLSEQVYLGRSDHATSQKIISDLAITHIINVTRDRPNAFTDRIKYLRLELDDENTSNLLQEFPMAVRFITDALNDGGRVLVHCNLGVSRSSTVVIAYLMFSKKWSLKVARSFLKEKRPIIRPNRGFLNQLSRFEEILFGKKLTAVENLYLIT